MTIRDFSVVIPAIIMGTLCFLPFDASADSEEAKPRAIDYVVKLVYPKDGDTLRPGQKIQAKVRIECDSKLKVPKQYQVTMKMGNVQAGQYSMDTELISDGVYEAKTEITVPKKPAKYTMKAEAVPINGSSLTEIEKVSKQIDFKIEKEKK